MLSFVYITIHMPHVTFSQMYASGINTILWVSYIHFTYILKQITDFSLVLTLPELVSFFSDAPIFFLFSQFSLHSALAGRVMTSHWRPDVGVTSRNDYVDFWFITNVCWRFDTFLFNFLNHPSWTWDLRPFSPFPPTPELCSPANI